MGPGLQPVGARFSNFLLEKVSLQFKLHRMSIFHDIQMATYFGTAWSYSHMVGYSGSPTHTVYVGVTLTRSKVKVNVTGLLNFRQLAKTCMLAAMTAAPLWGFLVGICLLWPKGWIDQDATWYGGRPRSRQLCVRWGPISPAPKKGHNPKFSASVYCGQTARWIKMPLGREVGLGPGDNFRPMSIVAKRSPISATAELVFHFAMVTSSNTVFLHCHTLSCVVYLRYETSCFLCFNCMFVCLWWMYSIKIPLRCIARCKSCSLYVG